MFNDFREEGSVTLMPYEKRLSEALQELQAISQPTNQFEQWVACRWCVEFKDLLAAYLRTKWTETDTRVTT